MLVKKRSKAYRLLVRISLISLALLTLGGLIYLVFFSSFFKIERVNVNGQELAPEFDIGNVGDSILFWDINEDDLPLIVESVDYEKNYLDKSVSVSFNERQQHIIWCYENAEGCYWVDPEGLLFSGAPDLRGPLVFKMVRDYSESKVDLGEKVIPESMFNNLVEAFNFLEEKEIEVREFIIEDLSRREAVARVNGGKEIYFSLTIDPHFGASVVDSLRESGDWDLIRYLDLRVKDRAYYSL